MGELGWLGLVGLVGFSELGMAGLKGKVVYIQNIFQLSVPHQFTSVQLPWIIRGNPPCQR